MIENYSWVPLSIRNGEREPFTLSDTIPESVKSIINKNIDNLLRDISPNFDFFFCANENFSRFKISFNSNVL